MPGLCAPDPSPVSASVTPSLRKRIDERNPVQNTGEVTLSEQTSSCREMLTSV